METANAPGIKAAVLESFEKDGQCGDWRDKVVSCVADGASVMTGRLNGMVKLMKDDAKHILGIHCICHRLELAIRDTAKTVSFLTELDTKLLELYKMYHYSAKMWEGLQTAGKALAINILKPPSISGTRWIALRERAVNALIRSWPAIVIHLSQVELLTSTDQAPRTKGLKKILTSTQFVLFLKLLAEHIYPRIAILSSALQNNTASVETLTIQLEGTLLHLKSLDVEALLSVEEKHSLTSGMVSSSTP